VSLSMTFISPPHFGQRPVTDRTYSNIFRL